MAEARLAPNLPDWMLEHANRYLASGGTVGHMYTVTPPGYPEMTVPSLLLTTTGRKSGEKFIFPLFYGKVGGSYVVVASKGGAPEHRVGTATWSPILKSRSRSALRRFRRGPGPPWVTSAPAFGRRRSASGHLMRTISARPSARSL